MVRLASVCALLSSLAGCSLVFEIPDQTEDAFVGPVGPETAPEDPISPTGGTPVAFVASAERTNKGHVVQGSFVDSHSLDGSTETILSEESHGKQKVEHRWLIGGLPEGKELELELSGVIAMADGFTGLARIELAIEGYDGAVKSQLTPLVVGEGDFHYLVAVPPVDGSSIEVKLKREADQEESWVIEMDYLGVHPRYQGDIIQTARENLGATAE